MLGDGTVTARSTPVAVQQGGIAYVQITAGHRHTCALASTGQTYCWGSGYYGQLGNGTTTDHFTPWPVQQGLSRYVEIDAGALHTCARSAGGQAYCWGYNAVAALGDGTWDDRGTPVAVHQSTVAFAQITAGVNVTCGRTEPGLVYCWGDNDDRQLGDGTTTERTTPTAVQQGTARYVEIENGWGHTCARSAAGRADCWGGNWSGQLGDGTWDNRGTPAAVQQGSRIYRQITVGGQHSCGLTAAGQAFCWGGNRLGQVGDGSTATRRAPVPVN